MLHNLHVSQRQRRGGISNSSTCYNGRSFIIREDGGSIARKQEHRTHTISKVTIQHRKWQQQNGRESPPHTLSCTHLLVVTPRRIGDKDIALAKKTQNLNYFLSTSIIHLPPALRAYQGSAHSQRSRSSWCLCCCHTALLQPLVVSTHNSQHYQSMLCTGLRHRTCKHERKLLSCTRP